MKKNRGFTLIELLAVIVILAIIALIAIPQVIKILNKARMSSAEDSVYGIVASAENYITEFMLKNNGELPNNKLTFSCGNEGCTLDNIENLNDYDLIDLDKLNYKGTKASSGIVTIENENIEVSNAIISGFTCNYPVEEKAKCYTNEDLKDLLEINNISITPTLNSIKVVLNISGNASKYEYSIDNINYNESDTNTYTFNNLEANHEYTIYVRVSNDSKTKESSKKIKTLELSAPEITVEKENVWTQSKTVTIKYPSGENLVYSYKIKSLDGNTILVDETIVTEETTNIEVTENSLVIATVALGSSNQSISKEVNYIDRTVPTINAIMNGSQMIINMNDDESKINSYCINTVNDKSLCEFIIANNSSVTYTVKKAGIYYIFAKDNAGNISDSFLLNVERICEKGKYDSIDSDKVYCSGSMIKNYGGYNWHVVSDDGENLTLLLDGGIKNDDGTYLQLNHCTNDTKSSTDCGVYNWSWTNPSSGAVTRHTEINYSWGKSLINNYLNNDFYNSLPQNIKENIITVKVCDDTTQKNNFGGYLQEELIGLNKNGSCPKYIDNNVRLLTSSEYFSLNKEDYDKYSSYSFYNLIYFNKNIDKLSDEEINNWLLDDDTDNSWFFMTKANNVDGNNVSGWVISIYKNRLTSLDSSSLYRIRPVITIKK